MGLLPVYALLRSPTFVLDTKSLRLYGVLWGLRSFALKFAPAGGTMGEPGERQGEQPSSSERAQAFTKDELLALPPEAKRYTVRCPKYRPLYLVVYPSGEKRWFVDFKVGRKHEREKVGRFPEVPIQEAIKLARGKVGQASTGASPAEARRQERDEARRKVPLREAWEGYRAHRLAHADERRKRSVRFEEGRWANHLRTPFGERPIDSLTRAEVSRWFVALTAKCGPVGANRARAVLSGIISYWSSLVDEELVNPCRGVRPNREPGRERYLTASELRAWWKGVLEAPRDTGELLTVLMLTAARQGTLRAMEWSEIDWQARSWRIPGRKMKAGNECVVPLNPPAFGVLRARWLRAGEPATGWVFASRSGKPRCELREPFVEVAEAAGLEDFAPHDCRRTAATAAADSDVDSAIVAHLLGHVDRTVLGRYRKVTLPKAAEASARMAVALLRPAGLEPGDFARGLPAASAMRPEAEGDNLLAFTVAQGDGQRD